MKYSSDEKDEHDLEDRIEFITFPGEKVNDGNSGADHSRLMRDYPKK